MKPKAAVAISGGIDSLVTAFLLKKKFRHIIGLHFVNGYEQGAFKIPKLPEVQSKEMGPPVSLVELPANHPLHHISSQLDIPMKLVDCRQYFQNTVVDYFVRSYLKGLTPNPCMLCNPLIKFGVIFNMARKLGVSCFSTGHYVRIHQKKDSYMLQKGVDDVKDQSYFLALVSRDILPFVQFPLGGMTKQQVIKIAEQETLTPVLKKESQDVCFIKNNNYANFIESQDFSPPSPGIITDINGNQIGTHDGLHHFTIGQRRGINCPASEPYYVIQINMAQNRLVVGSKKDLYQKEFTMIHINWFISEPESRLTVFVKIRYRHQPTEAILIPQTKDTATIRFKTPQPAVTPGQGAVCYINDLVAAGGWIDG